jgi:hypothetical protein
MTEEEAPLAQEKAKEKWDKATERLLKSMFKQMKKI